jgi:hypothetical protein
MNEQIDDLMILGFSFTQQQLEDLRAVIDIALSTFENSPLDPSWIVKTFQRSERY